MSKLTWSRLVSWWPRPPTWLLVSIPIAALVADLLLSPVVMEGSGGFTAVEIRRLLEDGRAWIGKLDTHNLGVSVGDVAADSYLDFAREAGPVALTASVFETDEGVALGTLTRSVLARIGQVAPSEGRRLRTFVAQLRDQEVGDVVGFELQLDPGARIHFPVDRLLIVVLAPDMGSDSADGVLRKALPNVIDRAAAAGVKTLVIPAIGHNWRIADTFPFATFYRALLQSVTPKPRPMWIYVDLYSAWPTAVMEEAVAELNAAIGQHVPTGSRTRVHRWSQRAILLLVAISLLSCSRRVRLSWKAFVAVCVSYIGLALGARQLVEVAGEGYGPVTRAAWTLVLYVVLAAAFPAIVHLDLKEIISKRTPK